MKDLSRANTCPRRFAYPAYGCISRRAGLGAFFRLVRTKQVKGYVKENVSCVATNNNSNTKPHWSVHAKTRVALVLRLVGDLKCRSEVRRDDVLHLSGAAPQATRRRASCSRIPLLVDDSAQYQLRNLFVYTLLVRQVRI